MKSYIPSQGESIQDFGRCGIGGGARFNMVPRSVGPSEQPGENVGPEGRGDWVRSVK